MNSLLKILFYIFLVKPLVYILLGLQISNREKLPAAGPAIIVANHNSHLDTLVLMSLFPVWHLSHIRPVANDEYFMRNMWRSWIATKLIGILPVSGTGTGLGRHNILNGTINALKEMNIVIIYPEGTRGEPEKLESFKRGVAVLTTRCPDVPVYPIFIHGLGKALPRGALLLVPFVCQVLIGDPIHRSFANGSKFMQQLQEDMNELAEQGNFPEWI